MTSCNGVQLPKKENATVNSSSLKDVVQIEGKSKKAQVKKAGRSRARLDANGENILEVSWKQNYHELVEYASKYGDCLVSRSHHDKKLYNWVILQRQEFKKWRQGKRTSLSDERKNALEKIGFVWRMRMLPKPVCWDTRFEELSAFQQEHGHTLVPQKYRPNVQLGRWVETQRRQYKFLEMGKANNLTSDRIEKLDSIGFVWSLRDQYETLFSSRVNELRTFIKEKGHNNPSPKDHKELHTWIQEQRRQYKNLRDGKQSSMTESRYRILEELGVDLSPVKSPAIA